MTPHDVLTDMVYAELKREIHQGEITAGERLVERSIAESKNVSRTPVREALRRLRSEGLTEYYPRRGFIVAALSSEDIDEIYVLREALEGLAIRETAPRVEPGDLDELYELIPAMEAAARDGHIEEMRKLNQQFHEHIIRLSGMKHVLQLVRELGDRIEYFRRQSLSLPGRPNHTIQEHRLILDTLKEQDPDLAEAAMRLHIKRAREAARVTLGLPGYDGRADDGEPVQDRAARPRNARHTERFSPGRPLSGDLDQDLLDRSEGGE